MRAKILDDATDPLTNTRKTNDAPIRPRRRRAAMALCVMCVATLGGLGLVEVILRIAWTPPADDRAIHSFDYARTLQYDAELGHIPRPGIIVEYPPYDAAFSTNALGLRGPEVPMGRSADRQSIVVLGDSFAWGHGVSTGEAFAEVIDAALPRADVLNLGVPGYDLAKSLVYYERIGRRFHPDLVIVSVCQNDFRVAIERHRDRRTARINTSRTASVSSSAPVSRRLKHWIRDHSYLYRLLQQVTNTNKSLARMAVSIGLKEELAGFELLDDNLRPALIDAPPQMIASQNAVRAQLLAMRDAIRADGADMLVALIPCIQAIDARELEKSIAYTKYEATDFDLDAPMKMLVRYCEAADITVVNPTDAFRGAFGRGESLYLPGDLHFNAEGHALFARCILDATSPSPATSNPENASRDRNKATTRQRSQ